MLKSMPMKPVHFSGEHFYFGTFPITFDLQNNFHLKQAMFPQSWQFKDANTTNIPVLLWTTHQPQFKVSKRSEDLLHKWATSMKVSGKTFVSGLVSKAHRRVVCNWKRNKLMSCMSDSQIDIVLLLGMQRPLKQSSAQGPVSWHQKESDCVLFVAFLGVLMYLKIYLGQLLLVARAMNSFTDFWGHVW